MKKLARNALSCFLIPGAAIICLMCAAKLASLGYRLDAYLLMALAALMGICAPLWENCERKNS